MGAIYGIVGDADPAELSSMGERLAHRGSRSAQWSLSPTIHLGIRGTGSTVDGLRGANLVFDGAMGSLLYERGVFVTQNFEQLNVARPDIVNCRGLAYSRSGRSSAVEQLSHRVLLQEDDREDAENRAEGEKGATQRGHDETEDIAPVLRQVSARQCHTNGVCNTEGEHAETHDDEEDAEESIRALLVRITEPARNQQTAHGDVKDRKERKESRKACDHIMKHGQ